MNTFAQWLHQHDFVILLTVIFAGSLILLSWLRLWTKKRILVWSAFLGLAVVFVLSLRTPAATVSEMETAVSPNSLATTNNINQPNALEIEFDSITAIEAYLQGSEKPTLVEFYSDFGIS